jgi:hypothetical protein
MKLKYNFSKSDDIDIPLGWIRHSAIIVVLLLFLFVLVDAPVTFFGWSLLLGIAIFLIYIIIQAHILCRNRKKHTSN